MRTKSLTPDQMEARVARFNKLPTYQRQNFETYNNLSTAKGLAIDVPPTLLALAGEVIE